MQIAHELNQVLNRTDESRHEDIMEETEQHYINHIPVSERINASHQPSLSSSLSRHTAKRRQIVYMRDTHLLTVLIAPPPPLPPHLQACTAILGSADNTLPLPSPPRRPSRPTRFVRRGSLRGGLLFTHRT